MRAEAGDELMVKLALIDARVKLLVMLAISGAALFCPRPAALLGLLLLTLITLFVGGVSPRTCWRQLHSLLPLIGFLFIIQCVFTRSGTPWLSIYGYILITTGGLQTAILVSLRLLIIVTAALLVLTGETRDYLLALTWCKLPYEIAYMVLAALRFLPLLRDEARSVNEAMQMRGCDLKNTSWRKRAQLYLKMLLPIAVGSLERAEQTAVAMEARGFRTYPYRSQWRKLEANGNDLTFGAAFLLLLTTIVIYF